MRFEILSSVKIKSNFQSSGKFFDFVHCTTAQCAIAKCTNAQLHKCTHWLVYKRVQLHFMTKSGAILGKGQFKKNGEKYLESSPFLASLDRTSVHGHSLRVLIKRAFSTSPLPINFAFDRSQIKILQ